MYILTEREREQEKATDKKGKSERESESAREKETVSEREGKRARERKREREKEQRDLLEVGNAGVSVPGVEFVNVCRRSRVNLTPKQTWFL